MIAPERSFSKAVRIRLCMHTQIPLGSKISALLRKVCQYTWRHQYTFWGIKGLDKGYWCKPLLGRAVLLVRGVGLELTSRLALSSANLILVLRFRLVAAFFGPSDFGASLQS